MCRLICFIAAVLLSSSVAWSAPTLGDYNGDSVSDLSVALVYPSDQSTAWLTRHNADSFSFWTFDVPADALVAGHWYGDQKFYPGLVYVRSTNIPLEWHVKNPQGSEIVLYYGLAGDNIPNQGDLDCDGITDFIVTRPGTAQGLPDFKYWYVALSGSGGAVYETLFGFATDKAGVADLDGDGCQEMIVLRGDTYVWYGRKLFDTGYSAVQWGLPGDLPLWPQDINGDGLADYIITRRTGFLQQAYVRYGNGPSDWETFQLGLDSSVPQVGHFRGDNFFTWHQRDTGWVAIGDRNEPDNIGELLLFGIPANAIIRADGSVVQPTEDGTYPPANNNPLGCDSLSDFIDGPLGYLWKAISEVTGRPVFLTPSEYWEGDLAVVDIEVFGEDNSLVATGSRRTCCPNGGRAHFDVSKSAAELKPFAPIIVKMSLQNGTTDCRLVEDPEQRYD